VYASPGSRLGAQVLDRLLLWAFMIPAGVVFGVYAVVASSMGYGGSGEPPIPTAGAVLGGGLTLLTSLAGFAYWIYLVGWRAGIRGQSPGKRLLGVHVRTTSGLQVPGGGAGLLRLAVMVGIAAVTCGFGGLLDDLWLLWDPQRQCLHDKVVSTVVVQPVVVHPVT
jgi:uncharacterized RDD family membrane protein YckC